MDVQPNLIKKHTQFYLRNEQDNLQIKYDRYDIHIFPKYTSSTETGLSYFLPFKITHVGRNREPSGYRNLMLLGKFIP